MLLEVDGEACASKHLYRGDLAPPRLNWSWGMCKGLSCEGCVQRRGEAFGEEKAVLRYRGWKKRIVLINHARGLSVISIEKIV